MVARVGVGGNTECSLVLFFGVAGIPFAWHLVVDQSSSGFIIVSAGGIARASVALVFGATLRPRRELRRCRKTRVGSWRGRFHLWPNNVVACFLADLCPASPLRSLRRARAPSPYGGNFIWGSPEGSGRRET